MAEMCDALRHKLIADLFSLHVWHRGTERIVSPGWWSLTIAERDLIADALRQWTPPPENADS